MNPRSDFAAVFESAPARSSSIVPLWEGLVAKDSKQLASPERLFGQPQCSPATIGNNLGFCFAQLKLLGFVSRIFSADIAARHKGTAASDKSAIRIFHLRDRVRRVRWNRLLQQPR
jgi:hypothetical protein